MAALVPAREDPRLSEWPAPSHNLTDIIFIIIVIIIFIIIIVNVIIIVVIVIINVIILINVIINIIVPIAFASDTGPPMNAIVKVVVTRMIQSVMWMVRRLPKC